jgi:hypothetical protein
MKKKTDGVIATKRDRVGQERAVAEERAPLIVNVRARRSGLR